MTEQVDNQSFYKIADSFIDLANNHCETMNNSEVGSAMLFAGARFSSFVVATHAKEKASFEAEIDHAVEHFTNEFKRMLTENLEQYKTVFDEPPKYEHLMNKDS